ncbi:hypothetical protein HO133_008137 [Letharia lupina]|uniref:Transcriptional coactivator HFI1/ADA1 n=1 Tax=Letharia lupina TaxID=560253 RepID=A0A8H6CRV1_9LECA|nr:uncharacterized protein HO133_008137 [Letharia lupina]KAF6228407.1 hypothetical protein HO133_008137 [Letharia lupina]
MPDIDPAALSRSDSISAAFPGALSLKQPNGISALPSQKAIKTVSAAQRIDLEPYYTSLKAAIGENFAKYKEAICLFILGHLNQNELSFQIDHYVTADPNTEHLHNQLIAGIFANVGRDLPEPGVAPWVSANDKPTVLAKPVSGDAAEQRLKMEIMRLPARDRRRLKEVPDGETYDNVSHSVVTSMNDYHAAKMIRLPDSVSASAGGLNKTNWDLEIRKRYSQPLASETGEFPDVETIHNRMVPICYEQSLPNGPSAACAEFMATATEQYIKSVVGSVLAKTRSNLAGAAGSISITTHRYRQQLDREEEMLSKGETSRGMVTNLLPAEAKEAAARRPLGMDDFRIALEVGGACGIGQMPTIVQNIMGGWPEGVLEGWGRHPDEDVEIQDVEMERSGARVNGVSTNSVHVNGNVPADHENYGWEGGSAKDREGLFSLLDECLAIGQ